jgi:hypothetical protein
MTPAVKTAEPQKRAPTHGQTGRSPNLFKLTILIMSRMTQAWEGGTPLCRRC